MADKKADLAGPGISTYPEVEKILPDGYSSLLNKKDTQKAIYAVKDYIEKNLCKALNLMMVQVPLIVDTRERIERRSRPRRLAHAGRIPLRAGNSPRLNAQVVQAATKWKRPALNNSSATSAKGFAPTCAPSAKITFSITTTVPTLTSGIGSASSLRTNGIWCS